MKRNAPLLTLLVLFVAIAVFFLPSIGQVPQTLTVSPPVPAAVPTLNKTGNGNEFATSTVAGVSGNCAQWDASGNVGDAGAACGSGGGGITTLTQDVTAAGTGSVAATVKGINAVALCNGFTPTNTQFLQYTTGGTPNPCWTAAAGGGGGGGVFGSPYVVSGGSTYGPLFQMTPPGLIGAWSWVNQGSATTDGVNGSLSINAPASASDSMAGLFQTAPATPYTVMAKINSGEVCAAASRTGVFFRQSSSGKLILFNLFCPGTGGAGPGPTGGTAGVNPAASIDKYTNPTTYAGSSYLGNAAIPLRLSEGWFRLSDNGTNLIFSFCSDNLNAAHCFTYLTVSRTDFMTSTGPDQIGFYVNPINALFSVSTTLLDWTKTTP